MLRALALLTLLAATTLAGDLNPPPGVPAPTMKTLDQIEARIPIGPDTTPGGSSAVYQIGQPGSYYLTADVPSQSGKHTILVVAQDVVIDLNSFTVYGTAGQSAITGAANSQIIAVRNGRIRRGSYGVNVENAGCVIEDLDVADATTAAIRTGGASVVRRCVISDSNRGVYTDTGDLVEDCLIRNPETYGIGAGDEVTVRRCKVIGGNGGIRLDKNALIEDCEVRILPASDFGVHVSANAVVRRTSISGAGDVGIRAETGSIIEQCSISEVDFGIVPWPGSRISDCVINDTIRGIGADSISGDSPLVANGLSVERTTFQSIRREAIAVHGVNIRIDACVISNDPDFSTTAMNLGSASVTNCSVTGFKTTGISTMSGSVIAHNSIDGVGIDESGIIVNGSDSIVEGNAIRVAVIGVFSFNGSRNRIVDNVINGGSDGVRLISNNLHEFGENYVGENTIRGAGHAVRCIRTVRDVINANTLDSGNSAVNLQDAIGASITRNYVLTGAPMVSSFGTTSFTGAVTSNAAAAGPWDNIQP